MSHWINAVKRIVIYTNLSCNNACIHCNSTFTRSYDKHWRLDLEHVANLLSELKRSYEFRLVGGEPTLLDVDTMTDLVQMIKKKDRRNRVVLLTNGYGVPSYPKYLLEMYDLVIVDNHGVNHEDVKNAISRLKDVGTPTSKLDRLTHYDLEEARRHPENKGKRCPLWMKVPALYSGLLLPCCAICWRSNIQELRNELILAGWHVHTEGWMKRTKRLLSLPIKVHRMCLDDCYLPDITLGTEYRIETGEKM